MYIRSLRGLSDFATIWYLNHLVYILNGICSALSSLVGCQTRVF